MFHISADTCVKKVVFVRKAPWFIDRLQARRTVPLCGTEPANSQAAI